MITLAGARRISLSSVAAVLLMILLVSAGNHAQSPSAPPATAVSKLRILYAGHPGSEREKDFVDFLKKYFDVVQTGNLQTFKEADTQGFDVTLLDWDTNRYEGPQRSEEHTSELQ